MLAHLHCADIDDQYIKGKDLCKIFPSEIFTTGFKAENLKIQTKPIFHLLLL